MSRKGVVTVENIDLTTNYTSSPVYIGGTSLLGISFKISDVHEDTDGYVQVEYAISEKRTQLGEVIPEDEWVIDPTSIEEFRSHEVIEDHTDTYVFRWTSYDNAYSHVRVTWFNYFGRGEAMGKLVFFIKNGL